MHFPNIQLTWQKAEPYWVEIKGQKLRQAEPLGQKFPESRKLREDKFKNLSRRTAQIFTDDKIISIKGTSEETGQKQQQLEAV